MYPTEYLNKDNDKCVYFFSSPFDPLNNWSAHVVVVDGVEFHTLEHAYHYYKFVNYYDDVATEIMQSPSPYAAMKIARRERARVRSDWAEVKVGVMQRLASLKYHQNEDVQENLTNTGKRIIVENSPWDDFWGIGKSGNGQNMMGKIWMEIRDGVRTKQTLH